MDTVFAIIVSFGTMLVSDDTKEFFKTALEEMEQGAKWHYVGMQPWTLLPRQYPDGCVILRRANVVTRTLSGSLKCPRSFPKEQKSEKG